MLKRNKKVRASGELLVAGLQRCLEQSDKELAVQVGLSLQKEYHQNCNAATLVN